jgi:acyl-CoA thioesterase
MKKFMFGFAVMALAVASAADTYRVTLFQPSIVAGKELKPGDYKVTVDGDKAVLSQGKNSVETQVKVETGDNKFNTTSVRYMNAEGKYKVQEIRIGNSNKKIVFANQDQSGL